ncbi:MAG: sulfatase [Chloroflexi bacterium]|nr:sulfatase [Chloroflexota bacterium]
MADVLGVSFRHAVRGALIGALAGAGAGAAEGYFLLATSRVARTALHEAAVYAVVLDSLVTAAGSALLALLLGLAGGLLAGRRAERPLTALHLLGAVAFTILASGFLWNERLQETAIYRTRQALPPPETVFPALAAAAVAGAVLAYALAGGYVARAMLRHPRGTAAATLATLALVAGVLPVMVVAEAQGYQFRGLGSRAATNLPVAAVHAADTAADTANEDEPDPEAWHGRPLNVVLITVDALRADHLGACGADDVATPHLDRLAARGTLFCYTQVHQPQTNPSLSSLFTGQYPASHGVRAHMTDRLPDTVPTLAKLLHEAGYATAGIAPWTSLKPAFSGLHQGFETYVAAAAGEPDFLTLPVVQGAAGVFRRIKDQLWIGRRISALVRAEDALEEQLDGRADMSTDHAMIWLGLNQREPFLLWVHYFDPHYPWTPPPPYDTLYDADYEWSIEDVYDGTWRTWQWFANGDWAPEPHNVHRLRALYKGEISYADEQIGRLLAAMEDLGLLSNTLVVMTADHGEGFGEHGAWMHGDSVYAHEIQVPLLFAGPPVPRGRRIDRLARQVDVLPTVLELLRLPPPPQLDGRSLVPLIWGDVDSYDRTSYAQIADDTVLAVITPDLWKLILDYRKDAVELYYLPEDPQEEDNRARREWWRVGELFGRLDRWAESKQMHWFKLPEFRFGM